MTQNEIVEMARQVGLFQITKDGYEVFYPDNLEAFAKLVAVKEREACAKICDDHSGYMTAIIGLKIRARGEA